MAASSAIISCTLHPIIVCRIGGLWRKAGRALAILVLGIAGLAALLCLAIAIDNDGDSDLIIGGLALSAVAVVVGFIAWVAQRALRPRTRSGAGAEPPRELERAEHGATVELRPRPLKWALLLLASLAFSAVLIPAALLAPSVLTVAGALLFGLGVVVSAWALVPGGMFLRVSPEGLLVKTPLRTRSYGWNDVENFRVFEVRSRYATNRFVGFDLRALTPDRQSAWQTLNRGMSGVDVGLPDTYGQDPQRLAEALDRLRERYASEQGPSPSARADRELAARAAAVPADRRVAVTWLVAVACAGVFVLEATRFDLAPTAAQLVELGGATRDAAWWSLLAGNVLHADLLHLLLNLVAWCVAGLLLEREIGAPRMGVLCVVAGVASMGVAVLLQPGTVTVGLSGVVFAALAWGLMRDLHRTRTLGVVAWSMLPIGVIYTFLSPGTSIGGHLGGLAAGLLLGWSLDRARGE